MHGHMKAQIDTRIYDSFCWLETLQLGTTWWNIAIP